MTLDEAYELTMQAVEELRRAGVEVIKEPSRSRPRESTVKKPGANPDGLPTDKWIHIKFKTIEPELVRMIHAKMKALGWKGICFDSSGVAGERDWDLDWSFFVADTPDGDMEASRDGIEDVLGDMDIGIPPPVDGGEQP